MSCIKRRINVGKSPDEIFSTKEYGKIYYDGQFMTIKEMSEKYHLNKHTVQSRLRCGIPLDRKLRVHQHVLEYKGEKYTFEQLSKKFNIDIDTLRARVRSGLSIDEAIHFVPYAREFHSRNQITHNGETHNIS